MYIKKLLYILTRQNILNNIYCDILRSDRDQKFSNKIA